MGFTVSRWIAAPSNTVWQLLVDLDSWPLWGVSVTRAEIDGDLLTLGTTGRVWTPVRLSLPFEITEFVPGVSWGWKVAGVHATRHGVDPDGDGCRVWMSVPWWAPAYLPVLEIAVRSIDQLASNPDA